MSDADATDPVKALREWCAVHSFSCQHVLDDLRAGKHRGEVGNRFLVRDAYTAALRSLEAAPALLARIEAGEGLLREARDDLFRFGLDYGYCEEDDPGGPKALAKGRALEGRIDAFLAGKEANRG